MQADESLITPELHDLVGRDGPTREIVIAPETVARVLETVGDDNPRRRGSAAPPYVLMAYETSLPLPESPAAPQNLVTGDEWTLHRPLRVGDRLTMAGRLASVHERFGSRFGHNLVLRSTWTLTGADGAVAAEIGRSVIRYRAPDEHAYGHVEPPTDPTAFDGVRRPPREAFVPGPPRFWEPYGGETLAAAGEGDPLPARVVYPSIHMVVRYCALTWNFVPFFFDPEEARRAGLPGTIVPGPLKLALLTRYLADLAGPSGAVRTVRCAHRRPDPTGRPLTLRGHVTRVEDGDDGRLLHCEAWTETIAGERSVVGSATIATG